jgi:tRNA(His) 5'-end guanylyltransferase
MAASTYFSHKQLQGKTSLERKEMLLSKDIDWNEYPDFFKRGTYVQKYNVQIPLSEEEWNRIPEDRRPIREALFTRTKIRTLSLPPLREVSNLVNMLYGEDLQKE